MAREDVLGLRALSVPGVAVVTLLFMRAHWAVMGRSGGRSIVLDGVETAIATFVLGGVFTPLIGDRVLTSPTMWFTVPAAQALIGGIIGTVWALALFQRTPASSAGSRRSPSRWACWPSSTAPPISPRD